MANPEHEAILRQGVEVWNKWREQNPDVRPDLTKTNLSSLHLAQTGRLGAQLHSANFSYADISESNLRWTDLSEADLRGANFNETDFRVANFTSANLDGANLTNTDLRGANLTGANLHNAKLIGSNMRGALLTNANLSDTDLDGTNLSSVGFFDVNITSATCAATNFGDVDFSTTKGLDSIHHRSPSTVGIDTLLRSKGKIPEVFLRGCGVPEIMIKYLPSMLEEAIQFYSCFISYSHNDKEFAKRLYDRLQGQGIRCWLDEHQLKPGDELHKTIYEGIRVYDKVILCCSETALKSWWVEKEFKNAISKEEDYTETVLIPITLDDYLFKQSADNWTVGEIKRRFVQDFSNWKDHDAFEAAFKKVVDALRTDGGKPPPPASKLTRRNP